MRILFISPLDRRTVPNTRDQNICTECRALGHGTLSLTLAQNTSRAPLMILRDSLSWRVHSSDEGRVICIDPPFNPCTGLQANLTHAVGGAAATPRPSGRHVAHILISALSPLSVLRDVAIIPVFLAHALARGRFDLCIAYGAWAACVGWLLRKLGRVDALIYDDQDYEPAIMVNRARQRWAAHLERAMMRRADAIVSVGHRLGALRRAQTGRDVEVIPNGVRLPATDPVQPVSAGPAKRDFTLLYVGNVVAWSGLDVMLGALPEVLASGQRLRVLIVGDGLPSYVQGLHAQVALLRLEKVVRFVGRVPNERVRDWLSQADVGLAHFRPEPYRRYAFPLKVVEYMSAGLAVIGTVDTETEDILRRHQCGIAVPFERSEIAAAIMRLAGDRDLRERCRRNAMQAAIEYQWSSLAARELQLVQTINRRRSTEKTA